MIKQNRFWLRTLNVRSEEGWLVKQLFLLQFLQGAGIAFFFTASFALFLDRFNINELPYIFIYAAFLLWIFGFLYSRAERVLSSINLAISVTLFMAVSIITFWFAGKYFDSAFFFYFMLAWFNVLYLLNNLEFWGLASLLFNARQSKRLFSVISAGDIPAKFFGYSVALFFVENIGTINLLLLGFGCMMLSVPFLMKIKRSESIPSIHHQQKHSVPQGGIKKLIHNFSGNSLTRSLALLSIIVTCSFLIINFSFYAGVKSSYHSDVSLAKFIAFFLAMVRVIALVIKMIFTSRLVNRFGNINSLLVTPVVMTIMVLAIVSLQDMEAFPKIILYMFGATSIVVDILRSSINSPVFLTIMQPLPAHDRLRAHTIVKGIMDPFASLITGLILIAVIELHVSAELLALCYVLLSLAALWFAAIYLVNRNYIRTVLKTISSRYFNNRSLVFDDANALSYLRGKVMSGNEIEAMNILGMISGSSRENQCEIATLALAHSSPNVKTMALEIISNNKLEVADDFIIPFLQNENEIVRIKAAESLQGEQHLPLLLAMLTDNSADMRIVATGKLFNHADHRYSGAAAEHLQSLYSSESPKLRAAAVRLLFASGKEDNIQKAVLLMNDDSRAVRESVFNGIAALGDHALVEKMMHLFPTHEKEITPALMSAGEIVLSPVREYISAPGTRKVLAEKLILVCGRIGGLKAQTILLTLLSQSVRYSATVTKALYRTNFTAAGRNAVILTERVSRLFDKCESLCVIHQLLSDKEHYHLLQNAISIEFDQAREELLYLLAMIFNREMINKVRHAFDSGQRDRIINAMEIIDLAVRKDLARAFNAYFEPGASKHPIQRSASASLHSPAAVTENILMDENAYYNEWTKACVLYINLQGMDILPASLVNRYTNSECGILREVAFAHNDSEVIPVLLKKGNTVTP